MENKEHEHPKGSLAHASAELNAAWSESAEECNKVIEPLFRRVLDTINRVLRRVLQ